MINVSVLITTLNEAENLPRCLNALKDFDEIIVIDSGSVDDTASIAVQYGADVVQFEWNGQYPKKRQWCLENIKTKHDYIFFIDGDEEVTPELILEIRNLDFQKLGYFVKGQYCWNNKILNHGLKNNKLALFHKNKFEFPVVDDFHDFSMGEIEGHYQPVLKAEFAQGDVGQLQHPLNHFAYEDKEGWLKRHQRYAIWEAGMIKRDAYPKEVGFYRKMLKSVFRRMPYRGLVAFTHSYILKLGFLDGRAGYDFACSRWKYYKMVKDALKTNKA